MSEQAFIALQAARKRLLEAQRQCSWCGQSFHTSEDLAAHIEVWHPSRKRYWWERRSGDWHTFDSQSERRSYYKFLRAVYGLSAQEAWKRVQWCFEGISS